MSFSSLRTILQNARDLRDTKRTDLVEVKEEIKIIESDIVAAQNAGEDTTALEANKVTKEGEATQKNTEWENADADEISKYGDLIAFASAKSQVEQLDEEYPILLFPVRTEIRFVNDGGHALLVRFFPDELAIETFEKPLMDQEVTDGETYWTKHANATTLDQKKGIWNWLCTKYGATRAAWIVINTETTYAGAKKSDSWTQQPYTRIMPDRFVVKLYDHNGNAVKEVEGNSIPDILKLGLDPDEDAISNDNGQLTPSPEVKWMIDFTEAKNKGMGIEIALTPTEYSNGFGRLVAVGVKTSSDENIGQNLIEQLFDNHHYTEGLAILKQGEPLKNSKEGKSGYTRFEPGNKTTYETERMDAMLTDVNPASEREKLDGHVLAEALGINYSVLDHIYRANGDDVQKARRFGNMSFEAVMGNYFLNAGYAWNNYEGIKHTRQFFIDYVSARGIIPSFRVGSVPYGIVPATVLSKMTEKLTNPDKQFVEDTRDILLNIEGQWEQASGQAPGFVGHSDSEQEFIELATGSAVSTDYYTRLAIGPDVTWNTLNLRGEVVQANDWYNQQTAFASNLKANSGLPLQDEAKIAMTNFSDEHGRLQIPFIQEAFLSNSAPITDIQNGNMNFFEWLAIADLKDIIQEDFTASGGNVRPNSLLYQVARKAVLMDYWHAAANYYDLDLQKRIDQELVNIPIQIEQSTEENYDPYNFIPPMNYYNAENGPAYSYFQYWERLKEVVEDYMENNPGVNMSEYITSWAVMETMCNNYDLANPGLAPTAAESKSATEAMVGVLPAYDTANGLPPQDPGFHLEEAVKYWSGQLIIHPDKWEIMNYTYQGGTIGDYLDNGRNNGDPQRFELDRTLDDLEYCKDIPSNEVDLLLRECFDVATDRYDAWKLGLFTKHLWDKRHDSNGDPIQGCYIGAYSWLEKLYPDTSISAFTPDWDATQNSAFTGNFGTDLVKDGDNKGFIWAPSVGQAITSALLRSGYINYTDTNQQKYLAIGMTSEKVRVAEEILSAVRKGQSVDHLLGYRLERYIHESTQVANTFIYELRRLYPIIRDPDATTDDEKDAVSARNLINGADALAAYQDHLINGSGSFGASILPSSSPPAELDQIFERLMNVRDALGDYAISEGVFQLTKGNVEAARAWIDVDQLGKTPPMGEFFKTPRTGRTVACKSLVNMTSVAFNGAATDISIREMIEPSLNDWLGDQLGAMSGISLTYRYKKSDETIGEAELTLDTLVFPGGTSKPVSHLDLVFATADNLSFDGSPLASFIREAILNEPTNPTEIVDVDYTKAKAGTKSLHTVYPLIRQLRKVLEQSRALKPDDFAAPGVEYDDLHEQYDLTDLYNRVNKAFTVFKGYGTTLDVTSIPTATAAIKEDLQEMAQYGIMNAIGVDLDGNYNAVFDAVSSEYKSRLLKLGDTIIVPVVPTVDLNYEVIDDYVKKLGWIIETIFGSTTILLPQFTNPSLTSLSGQASTNTLLDATDWNTQITLDKMDTWLHSVSRVRKPMETMEWLNLISDDLDMPNPLTPGAFQLPYIGDGNDYWMMLDMPADKLKDNVISYAVFGVQQWSGSTVGLLIDTWTETIPDEEETTGVAIHYNQPKSQAPQALILAVSPTQDGTWSWDDLLECVNSTFKSAIDRGTAFEQLAVDYPGQLLPALKFNIQEVSPV